MHQLRLHMNSLGLPIVGDNFYPTLLDTDRQDYSDPLQLLAKRIEFDDPITGEHRRFASRRRLEAWPDTWPDARADEGSVPDLTGRRSGAAASGR